MLSNNYDLNGPKLKEAVIETFKHRGTNFDDIFAFTDDFALSEIHQRRWKAFLKKKQTIKNAELSEVIKTLKSLLRPVVESIGGETEFVFTWNCDSCCWK